MASTYVNDLRLNEMATGDASGSWGTVTNTNLELIGEAFSYGTETIGDADSTLTIADGAADAARSFYLKITSSVDLTTTRIVTLGPNTVSKVWMIENATTGSQVITIKQGSGATINVPNGQVKMISTDGAGSGGAVLDLLVDVDLTGTTTLVNLDVSGTALVTGVLTTTAATVFNGGFTANADSTLGTDKKVQFRDAAIYINSSVDGQLDIVADTEIQIAATTIDVNGALDVSGTALVTGVLTTTAATVSNGGGQFNGAINVGVDDTGYDVKFFGATAGAYMLWDESADDLILGGAAGLSVNSTALVTGVLTTTAATVFNGGFASNANSTVGGTLITTGNMSISETGADNEKSLTIANSSVSGALIGVEGSGGNRFVGSAVNNMFMGTTGADGLEFATNNTVRMVIESGGDVGIGTTSPASYGKFVVRGSGNLVNFDATSGPVYVAFKENTTNRFFLATPNGSDGLLFVDADGSSERMRIDSSGRLNVGQTSAYAPAGGGVSIATFEESSNSRTNLVVSNQNSESSAGASVVLASHGADYIIEHQGSGKGGALTFTRGTSEVMRMDSSGNLLVGTTSTAPNVSVGHVFSAAGSTTTKFNITSPNEIKIYNNNNATGTAYVIDYRQSNISKGGITVGSSSVTYATTSDYRLKTDAQPMVGASDRVLALKPVNFEWISSGERVDGFLAHEAQEIVPEAVTGTKDAVDADGNPDYQGIDQSKLVPLLTAALQEALTKIADMEIRLSALEG
jgi:hypothetical protein